MLLTPAQIKLKSFKLRQNPLFFFARGVCTSCLHAHLGARLLPQSYQYPNLLQDADRVGGQLHGDKECPFSDVTKSGSVWRKVPESGAGSVPATDTVNIACQDLSGENARKERASSDSSFTTDMVILVALLYSFQRHKKRNVKIFTKTHTFTISFPSLFTIFSMLAFNLKQNDTETSKCNGILVLQQHIVPVVFTHYHHFFFSFFFYNHIP